MKSIKQNMFVVLVGVSLALAALFTAIDATTFVYDFGTGIQTADYTVDASDKFSHSQTKYFLDDRTPARAILNARRPFQQMHFRHQRGNSVRGFSGRDAALQVRPGSTLAQWSSAFVKRPDGYPSHAIFCTAKEYYVFTLKRILC